jgi:hypothetical protein
MLLVQKLFGNYSQVANIVSGLQVEGLFSVQGNEDNKLSYISVPVLPDLRLARTFSILAGPQISLNVSKPDEYDDRYTVADSSEGRLFEELYEIADNNEIAPIDFGFAFGAQYTITKHLVIGARYNLGLTPVRTFKEITVDVSGYANRVIQLSAGWLF